MKAHEYAETIAEEIRALETALDGPSRSFDPDDATQDDEQDTHYRAALDVLEYAHDIDHTDIFAIYVNETILEVIYWNGSNEETRTEWLRTCGGPTCRIYFDGSDYAEVVSTGDDNNTARVSVYVPTLAEMVNTIADEMVRA